MFIVERDGEPVATTRYTRVTSATARVHIVVARESRRQGLGTAALALTAPLALRLLSLTAIEAMVRAHNAASLRAFLKCGFAIASDRHDVAEGLVLLKYQP